MTQHNRDSNIEQEEKRSTVIRIVHNRENPYVQLNKKALWDERLSLKAVGLWARCMSRPHDWKFSIAELAKSGKEGRRAIDSAMKELIDNHYAVRLEYYERDANGQFVQGMGGIEYVFFEFQASEQEKQEQLEIFKKSFRYCGFGNRRNGNSRNAQLLNKEEEQKKEETKEGSAPPSGASPPPVLSDEEKPKKKPKRSFPKPVLIERMGSDPEAEEFKNVFNTPLVGISDKDHEALIKKHGEGVISRAYNALAEWKLSKAKAQGISDAEARRVLTHHNDKERLTKWVIKEVLADPERGRGTKLRPWAIDIDNIPVEPAEQRRYAFGTKGEKRELEICEYLSQKEGRKVSLMDLGNKSLGKVNEIEKEMLESMEKGEL